MLHTKFCENRPAGSGEENAPHEILLVSEKKVFESVYGDSLVKVKR